MARCFVSALVLLSLAGLSISAGRTDYPPIVKAKTLYAKTDLRGKQAPTITAKTWLTGPLPSMKNKVVVVDFWATWCPPCRETIPELGEWQKKYKGLVVIGISSEDEKTVREFMKKTPMPYNVGVDPEGKTDKLIGVEGIPHILVITPDGIVRWQGFPLDEKDTLTEEKLVQIMDAAHVAKNPGVGP